MVKKRTKTKTLRVARVAKKQQEVTRLGQALRSLGGLGGAAVGGIFGMPNSGAMHGSSLGAALSKWLGSGDYQVSTNSLVNSMKASGSIPMMHKNDQTIIVRHKEFIGEIKSSIAYNVQYTLELNPGVGDTFPWLANIAKNYQEYRFKGVVFHYVPTSGSAGLSTNNALGSVMMQTSYRATDTPPDTKREILNEYWSTEIVPSETVCHPIECNPAENPFNVQYVRQTTIPSGDNLLLYDLGRTYVATSGQQADGIVLGDLWVTYEVELKKPVLFSNVTLPGSNVITFNTPASTLVKAGAYFDSTTAVTNVTQGIVPAMSGARGLVIPARFEGYVYVICRLSAASPYIDTNGVSWSAGFTTSGPITSTTALLAGSARWDTVNETGAGFARSLSMIGGFLKVNTGSSVDGVVTIPQAILLASGATSVSFSCAVVMIPVTN